METQFLCDYGCGQEANYVFKNGKRCCCKSKNSCPQQRSINGASMMGENNPMYGKTFSEEQKEKWSKERSGDGNPMWGKRGRISGEKNPRWNKGYLIEGPLNPAWKGGISRNKNNNKYGQGFTQELKEQVRERDKHICCLCNNFGNNVHHIDYDKNNHDMLNLVTLCGSCHSKTNYNREEWRQYFESRHTCLYMHKGEILDNSSFDVECHNKPNL